jgi:hypothetical protein
MDVPGREAVLRDQSRSLLPTLSLVARRSSCLFALSRPLPLPFSSLVCCLAYFLLHPLDPFISRCPQP